MLQTFEFSRDPQAPAHARRAIDGLGSHLDEPTAREARLLVSELVTNSVIHGDGDAVRMVLEVDRRGRLRCEVIDAGSGFVPMARPPERETPGGWGLGIVEQVADRWGVREGSTHVWFELPARRSAEPPVVSSDLSS
jgi:anti-sigma regulatory factor (Ser/Thr protein kinase)